MMDIKSIALPIIPIKANGTNGGQAFEFLECFEIAALANQWDDRLKLNQVGCYLEGEAHTWIKTMTRVNHTTFTWCQFRREYLQHVCKIDMLQLNSFFFN
jgi:hypothetical protein